MKLWNWESNGAVRQWNPNLDFATIEECDTLTPMSAPTGRFAITAAIKRVAHIAGLWELTVTFGSGHKETGQFGSFSEAKLGYQIKLGEAAEAQSEIEDDPDDLYVRHLENAGYWDAREDEERYGRF